MTTAKGLGFVNDEAEQFPEDVLIEAGDLNTAMNGDSVEFVVLPKKPGYIRRTGRVSRVVKRARARFVGVLSVENGAVILSPDDNRAYMDFVLPGQDASGVRPGDKAMVKFLSWDNPARLPVAELIRTLGRKGEHGVEMESIVLDKGFDTSFPEEVEKEAQELKRRKTGIVADEVASAGTPGGRRDFRHTLTFTIDPADAKDFDDAVSFKEVGSGRYEIGVHIADVSHFVRPGNALDKEALRRGSSVYLVDRTIPMLPEALSNDLCSLNPNEDKLAFSAVFVMDGRGRVHERWFGKTVINSNKRFTYEEGQEILDSGLTWHSAGQTHEKTRPYFKEMTTLNKIAKILQSEKFKAGAIEFEQDEIKFKLDSSGKPLGVYRKERKDIHKMVEEFMLLANREVARHIYDSVKKRGGRGGSIYRIHDKPDKEKIVDLGILVRALGHYFPETDNIAAKDLNAMLSSIKGTPEESLVKTAAVRSMAKAIYSTKNVGHFGLAFPFYTHFTSPIRRYPDLMVHRILFAELSGTPGAEDLARLENIAVKSTEREIAAAEAERASVKYKQVEFMQVKTGQTFDGVISGVTDWGIYVEEADTRCEGMVSVRSLSDDYYELNKKAYSLVGKRTGRCFRLGDKIRFKVAGGDLERKTLDYVLA